MDSLRKKPAARPLPPPAPLPRPSPRFDRVEAGEPADIKPLLKKEELFISQEEAAVMGHAETKFQKGKLIKKIFLILILVLIVAALAYGGYFFWKAHAISGKMDIGSKSTPTLAQDLKSTLATVIPSERKILDGESIGRINILLLGAAGKGKPGTDLTDTIMVMSIDTKNKKIAMLSLPRDLYVNVPGTQSQTKINALYEYGLSNNTGIDPLKQTIETITGVTINYYIVADFDGFQKLIDDIGGINVTVARDMHDTTYPGPNYSYETFDIKKGFQSLDGAVALQYVRERHDDPQGDFGRALRQQQVIQAVKNKVFSAQTLLDVFALNNVLNTLGDNIQTNISFDDMGSFIALSKELDTQNITNVVADAWKPDSLLKVSHVQVGSVSAFVLLPRVGNYSEIQDLAANIFTQDELKKRQDAIAAEQASIGIINESGDNQLAGKILALLRDKLGMKNAHIVSAAQTATAPQTTVSDNSSGAKLFTLDELVKKIPATLSSQPSPENNSTDDLTLVLGSDIVKTYNYEEASIDAYNQAQDQQDNIDLLNTN